MASQETDRIIAQESRTEERMSQADELHFLQGEDLSDQESGALLMLPLDADKRTIGYHHGTLLATQDAALGRAWRTDDAVRETASEQYRYNLVGLDNTYTIVELVSYCAGYSEGYKANSQAQQEQAA